VPSMARAFVSWLPLSCSYCASRFLHPGYVPRPAPVVAEELAFLQNRLGVGNFAWYDDALLHNNGETLPPRRTRAFPRRRHRGLSHSNGLHVRWATPEVLDGMKSAGFETLRFGYETGGGRLPPGHRRKNIEEGACPRRIGCGNRREFGGRARIGRVCDRPGLPA